MVGSVENEEHFLLHCPEYHTLRTKYIVAYIHPDKPGSGYLIDGHGVRKTRDVAMYIYYALEQRNQTDIQEALLQNYAPYVERTLKQKFILCSIVLAYKT